MSDQNTADDMTGTVLQAKDYLKNYDGPILNKFMSLGCTVMKQIYKRDAPLFQRNALYITYFARLIFRDSDIDQIEDHHIEKIEEIKKSIQASIQHYQKILEESGVETIASNSQQLDFEAPYLSPLYRSFLEVLQLGDNLSSLYNTLWLSDLMKSRDFQAQRKALKKAIRALISQIRASWIGLVKRAPGEKAAKAELISAKKRNKSGLSKGSIASEEEGFLESDSSNDLDDVSTDQESVTA